MLLEDNQISDICPLKPPLPQPLPTSLLSPSPLTHSPCSQPPVLASSADNQQGIILACTIVPLCLIIVALLTYIAIQKWRTKQ